jgi:hypothetical protein
MNKEKKNTRIFFFLSHLGLKFKNKKRSYHIYIFIITGTDKVDKYNTGDYTYLYIFTKDDCSLRLGLFDYRPALETS